MSRLVNERESGLGSRVRLRQLEYFLRVVDEGSFTKAASALYIAQPSLSTQISALEREVGGPLLERLPRGIRLTAAGRVFEAEIRASLHTLDRAVRGAQAAFGLRGGELEMTTVTSVAIGVLPVLVSEIHQQYPEVTLRVAEFAHRRELEEAMRGGMGDVAIGPRPSDWSGEVLSLGYEEFVVVLPRWEVAEAPYRRIRLKSLADRDWVLYEESNGLNELVRGICRDEGFVPRGGVRASQVSVAIQLAAAGMGPALVPRNVIPEELSPAVRSLDPPIYRELTMYGRGGNTSLTPPHFIDLVLRVMRNSPILNQKPVPEALLAYEQLGGAEQ